MITFNLYDSKFKKILESGSYIGELTNTDAVAEELVATFPKWEDESILQVTKGTKITRRNTNIYRVKFLRPVEEAQEGVS
jgi:hypothetical protein